MQIGIVVQSVVMTAAVLGAYAIAGARIGVNEGSMLQQWQTVAFGTLTLSELFRAFTARSERTALFKIGVFSNKWMLYAVLLSIGMLIAVLYVPFLQTVFGTVPLTLNDWVLILPFALVASIAAEATKVYLRARAARVQTVRTAQMEIA